MFPRVRAAAARCAAAAPAGSSLQLAALVTSVEQLVALVTSVDHRATRHCHQSSGAIISYCQASDIFVSLERDQAVGGW